MKTRKLKAPTKADLQLLRNQGHKDLVNYIEELERVIRTQHQHLQNYE